MIYHFRMPPPYDTRGDMPEYVNDVPLDALAVVLSIAKGALRAEGKASRSNRHYVACQDLQRALDTATGRKVLFQ